MLRNMQGYYNLSNYHSRLVVDSSTPSNANRNFCPLFSPIASYWVALVHRSRFSKVRGQSSFGNIVANTLISSDKGVAW